MYKLLYIGKSNKRFTHNMTYEYGSLMGSENFFYATVYYNRNQMMTFKDGDYFHEKFKFITEIEYNQLLRKKKINRINKLV